MRRNLLLITTLEIPPALEEVVDRKGGKLHCARGGLKVRELIESQEIALVIWNLDGYSAVLKKEVIQLLCETSSIPVIALSKNPESFDISAELKNPFYAVEIFDVARDFPRLLEELFTGTAQSQDNGQTESDFLEMDFRNAFHQILSNQSKGEDRERLPILKVLTPWTAVDQVERAILSGRQDEKKPIINKMKGIFNKKS
ncbi:MAG: hypothetical protein OEY59_08790 [Deltaproteobacteria bacterium]|nr:hypothetical protein [Deltaproteobacteria bacterium]